MNNINIKNWYQNQFPTDEMGEEINPNLTFETLEKNVKEVYNLIWVHDSVIRERIFEELAKLKGVDYKVIYDQWLE